MSRKKHWENLTPVCQLVTYGLLVVAVLFQMFAGIRLFRNVTELRDDQDHLRSTVAYVQNELFVCEDPLRISVGKGPEGDLLILPLADSEYAVKIYLYEGYIREELSIASDGADPTLAEKISDASSFSLDLSDPSVIRVSIDGRLAVAHLWRWDNE